MSERWYDGTSAYKYDYDYDGTSAYKIDEYYKYTEEAEKNKQIQVENQKKIQINYKKAIAVISLIFALGIAFLYANVVLIQTSTQNDELKQELEDAKGKNTQTSFDIVSGIDLKKVEEKAVNEFGMQQPESYQNVYVDVVLGDYTQTYNEQPQKGITEKMTDGLKAFLTYID